MSVNADIGALQNLCKTSARCTLDRLLALGPKPDDPLGALLWEQQATRLQGQLNSLTAMVSKLSAAAVLDGLAGMKNELATVGKTSKDAETKIKQIAEISDLLTALSKVLDLGLAVLTAATAPTAMSIAAVLKAGKSLADNVASGQ